MDPDSLPSFGIYIVHVSGAIIGLEPVDCVFPLNRGACYAQRQSLLVISGSYAKFSFSVSGRPLEPVQCFSKQPAQHGGRIWFIVQISLLIFFGRSEYVVTLTSLD